MIIGSRIAALMQAQGISQAELARRIGVAQPTVFKMLHDNKTGSVHLHKVAKTLKTTSAYLTGETDDPSLDASALAISPRDVELLDLLHSLSPRDLNAVRVLAQTLADRRPDSTSIDESFPIPVLQSPRRVFKGAE